MPSYAVTGASRGIGLEFVKQLSDDSSNIVLAIVRNKATATRVTELGRSNVHLLQADITDYEALKAAAERTKEITGGSLDALINNAANTLADRSGWTLDQYTGHEALLEEDLMDSFKVNVIGVVHTINAFLPLLQLGKLKKVITISSAIADADTVLKSETSLLGPYSISKAGVNMVVAKYAVKFKEAGIIFLALSPGVVNTGASATLPTPEQMELFQKLMAGNLKLNPNFKGPVTPEESVKLQLQVIDNVTIQDTGSFISHFGNKEWI